MNSHSLARTCAYRLIFALSTLSVACAEDPATLMLPGDGGAQSASPATGGQTSPDGGMGSRPILKEGDKTSVTIGDGLLDGVVEGQTHRFLGIPYAKPPLGDLRWKLPVKNDKWTGPRDATQFGKRCAQLNSATLMNPPSMDEDCLYLNVWSPQLTPAQPFPVMFWIHGGGNQNGSASEAVPYANTGLFYNGKSLAEHGVVVVTFNYRLGAFGFFAHPEIAAESGGAAGNQGLYDQAAALTWVQENISKFGGDPKKVTIFGESAGSLDVCFHMTSLKTRNLFHGAISQSGGCTTKHKTLAEGQAEAGARLQTALACTNAACLRAKSVSDILNVPAGAMAPVYNPIVEGANGFLSDQPRALFDSGNIAKVPYILGSNEDEGTLFTLAANPADEAALRAELMKSFPGVDLEPILAAYPQSSFMNGAAPDYKARLARIVGDSRLVCSTSDSGYRASAAAAGLPGVWMYNFNMPVVIESLMLKLGATHGAELAQVFGTSPAFTDAEKANSAHMQNYWTNFAKTGDPNGAGEPKWEKFSEANDVRINFAPPMPTSVTKFRTAECALWRAGYARQFM
jgi:para-nitrobenzyl esterase